MPNLENPGPIRRLTIIQRTIEELNGAATAGIVWGTNNKPFPEAPDSWFEGPTSWAGLDPAVVNTNYGELGVIEASSLTEAIRLITQYYTRIRNMRCVRVITGGGGNRPNAGSPYTSTASNVDQTKMAFTKDGQQPTIISNYFDIQSSSLIYRGNVNNFILGMSQRYQLLRPNVLGDDGTSYKVSVCHASCHTSCHSSRGRR
jgi:hypothetical protein